MNAHDAPLGVYESVRGTFAAMLRTMPPTVLSTSVPATPEWTVHDVVAHLVGLAADLNAQRLPGDDDPGGLGWNRTQVSSRGDWSLDDLLREWDVEGPVFADGLALFGHETECHFVGDLVTHVLDVAEAVDAPIDLSSDAIDMALEHYTAYAEERLAATGGSMPTAVLALGPLDRLRLLSARRPLSTVPGADVLAAVYDGTGYTFPTG